MLRIDKARFLRNLEELANIGRLSQVEGGGLDRRPFSAAERAARSFFQKEAEGAGLEVACDAAANLSALLPTQEKGAKTLLLGSHLDTVPNGGPYDGALGVLAALEVLRVIHETGIALPYHLEAIAFTDEEGRFGDFFGSRALAGSHTKKSIDRFLANAGAYPDDLAAVRGTIPGALKRENILAARRDPKAIAAFLELHIEQGPQLGKAGLAIGVVDTIFGRESMRIVFHGRADHAGTTPLAMRADALVAAAKFVAGAPVIVGDQFPKAVVTCGNLSVEPGVTNVVPGEAAVWVEFRAARVEALGKIKKALLLLAAECAAPSAHLSFVVEPADRQLPVPMDGAIQAAIREASISLDQPSLTLSSGALHDAGLLAAIVPAGMILVPSIGGRSHCPEEETDPADLVAGADTLLNTILLMARQQIVT